jgi:hypothetical protein
MFARIQWRGGPQNRPVTTRKFGLGKKLHRLDHPIGVVIGLLMPGTGQTYVSTKGCLGIERSQKWATGMPRKNLS